MWSGLRGAVVGILLGLAMISPSHASFEQGLQAYQSGQPQRAAALWRSAAEGGDLAAMRNLGNLYRRGDGVSQDLFEAEYWYKRAAMQGFDRAQFNLAALYQDGGPNFPPRLDEAAHWYEQAAAQGNPHAHLALGLMLLEGQGIPQDEARATTLLQTAAASGLEAAAQVLRSRAAMAPAAQPAPAASAASESAAISLSPESDVPPPPPTSPPAPPRLEGTLAHLGSFRNAAAARAAWEDLSGRVEALAGFTPHLLPGFVPGEGDLIRLYAKGPEESMSSLCAALARSAPDVPCELHLFLR